MPRIYDRALTVAQIAALKPNQPSDPVPWAWWSFENGKTEEHTGKFKDVACLDGTQRPRRQTRLGWQGSDPGRAAWAGRRRHTIGGAVGVP